MLSMCDMPIYIYQNPKNNEIKEVTLNPDLDEVLLNSLIKSARSIIVNLYNTCENDFIEGIHIFEAIVAYKSGKTMSAQMRELTNIISEYLSENDIPI